MAATYFLIACKDEPPRSFRLLIALQTISEVGGWEGFVLGFLAFFGEAAFLTAIAEADVGDAATTGAVTSAILLVVVVAVVVVMY